jgi:transcriptional regulator with XRE-family HTH domain
MGDTAILRELGARVERARLDSGLTQEELARVSGLGKRTVERVEKGEPAGLVSLIRLLRGLGLVENLNALLPDTGLRPMDMLKLGKSRQRAAKPRQKPGKSEWRWGEDG